MLSGLFKKLAGQTAIYGIPNIIGRFLNYLLVPLHTAIFVDPSFYGIITIMYAYASFLMIGLSYGTETTYFRNIQKHNEAKVFSTLLFSLLVSGSIFTLAAFAYAPEIAIAIGFPNYGIYIKVFALILVFDSIAALALARLRHFERAIAFASINLTSILVNVGMNLLIIYFLYPYAQDNLNWQYSKYLANERDLIFLIFIANLAQALVKFIAANFVAFKHKLHKIAIGLLPVFWKYGGTIAFIGLLGILNETADRIFLKEILSTTQNEAFADLQVGIYGANYKLAMLVTLLIQAFRFAAEPFFFKTAASEEKRDILALVLNYFTAFALLVALIISLNLDFFKGFIRNPTYYAGLQAVPILLLANVFFGVSINLSIWYKMSKKTHLGIYVAIVGAAITIIGNLLFIEDFGFMASAYSTLICYASICVVSYIMCQKHYPIPYDVKKLLLLFTLAIALFLMGELLFNNGSVVHFIAKNAGIILFAFSAFKVLKSERLAKHKNSKHI